MDYPFIVFGGVLQTFGAAMNAQLYASLENRWLASTVSFAVITAFFLCVFLMFPAPLSNSEKLLGAVVGAFRRLGGSGSRYMPGSLWCKK